MSVEEYDCSTRLGGLIYQFSTPREATEVRNRAEEILRNEYDIDPEEPTRWRDYLVPRFMGDGGQEVYIQSPDSDQVCLGSHRLRAQRALEKATEELKESDRQLLEQ